MNTRKNSSVEIVVGFGPCGCISMVIRTYVSQVHLLSKNLLSGAEQQVVHALGGFVRP